MHRNGFALLEILIVVAVIIFIVLGGWYVSGIKKDANIIQVGADAKEKALDAAKKLESQSKAQEDLLNQLPQ